MSQGALVPPVASDDHVAGSAEAPVTLVEYGDFECPHCGRAYPIVKSIQRELGTELRFVFRNFPLSEAHPHAEHAAEAAEGAAAQGRFWEMHDTLFEHQAELEDADLVRYAADIGIDAARLRHELMASTYARKVRDHFRSGVRSGVNGTPTFFINGQRFDGNWSSAVEFLRALRERIPTAARD